MYEHQDQIQTDDGESSYYGDSVVSDYLYWRQVLSGDSVGLRLLSYEDFAA